MSEPRDTWTSLQLAAFRFLAIFWSLNFLVSSPGAVSLLDLFGSPGGKLGEWIFWPARQLALFVAVHVFHLTGESASFHPTGSGDTAMNWTLLFCYTVLSALGCAVWSALDRRRGEYRVLDAWLRLLLSFTLGATLLGYGFAKVFPAQFGSPSLITLNESYGESSPMRLLWTFMAASHAYQFFCGMAECIPGMLLFFRRTRTAGALLSAAVMLNVAALNFCYDVPVKIYSSLLFLLSLWLAGPDLAAVFRLFFLRRQVQLRTDGVPAVERKWLRRTAHVLQAAVLLLALGSSAQDGWQGRDVAVTPAPLAGIWRVSDARSTVKTVPWTKIILVSATSAAIATSDGKRMVFSGVKVDEGAKTIVLTSQEQGKVELRYRVTAPHVLQAEGTWKKAAVAMNLERTSADRYPLQTRGFHWVSEYPYNR